jgi:hypothetical protein
LTIFWTSKTPPGSPHLYLSPTTQSDIIRGFDLPGLLTLTTPSRGTFWVSKLCQGFCLNGELCGLTTISSRETIGMCLGSGDVRVRDEQSSIHRVLAFIPLANIEFLWIFADFCEFATDLSRMYDWSWRHTQRIYVEPTGQSLVRVGDW